MRTILIAEDEELFRRELAAATPWEELGFVLVGEAEDGEAALALVRERKPDAILADIRMPRLDGIGLLRRIEAELSEEERPLAVLVTGHSEFGYARDALRLGAFDYILKPLDDAEFADVLGRLAAAIDERKHARSLEQAASSEPALAFFQEYAPPASRDLSDSYIEKAVAAITERYVTALGAEEVAAELGISGGHLARIFKARTGLTFAEYLMRYRMKRAVELLRDPSVRVGEVADLVGYADQRHFSVLFRRLVGLTPTSFREGRLGAAPRDAGPAEADGPADVAGTARAAGAANAANTAGATAAAGKAGRPGDGAERSAAAVEGGPGD
jgi:two-component system response regulator YesN